MCGSFRNLRGLRKLKIWDFGPLRAPTFFTKILYRDFTTKFFTDSLSLVTTMLASISNQGILMSELVLELYSYPRSASVSSSQTRTIVIESVLDGLRHMLLNSSSSAGSSKREDMQDLFAPFMSTDQGINTFFTYIIPVFVNEHLLQRCDAEYSGPTISITVPIRICSMERTQHALLLDMYSLHSSLSADSSVLQRAIWERVIDEKIIETCVFNEGSANPVLWQNSGHYSAISVATDEALAYVRPGNTSSSSSSSSDGISRSSSRSSGTISSGTNSRPRKRPRRDDNLERDLKTLLKPFTMTEGMEMLFVHVVPIIVHFVLCRGFELED